MRADILIVGQGLAGTLLGWEFERAGIPFRIADRGHEEAASRIAAGIVNPITGRRLVKSWRIDALLPAARAIYRELENALAVPLWHEMRVRRRFADERERRVALEKHAKGELAPYVVNEVDDAGFWIEAAARVDVGALLHGARERWRARGWLEPESINVRAQLEKFHLVIDCTGASGARESDGSFLPWEFSKGEILALKTEQLAPGVILNHGHWLLPVAPGLAWIGATHQPQFSDLSPTVAARTILEASAAALLGRPFLVTGHFSGVRVNLPDKRPAAGRHPRESRLGIINGLGAKGVLWAPFLARQWINHLTEGVSFDAEIDAGRFANDAATRKR